MSSVLAQLQADMSYHMDKIKRMFKPGAKITVVVRNPALPDADVVMGDDDLDKAIEAIRESQKREPTFRPPASPAPPSPTSPA